MLSPYLELNQKNKRLSSFGCVMFTLMFKILLYLLLAGDRSFARSWTFGETLIDGRLCVRLRSKIIERPPVCPTAFHWNFERVGEYDSRSSRTDPRVRDVEHSLFQQIVVTQYSSASTCSYGIRGFRSDKMLTTEEQTEPVFDAKMTERSEKLKVNIKF